MANTINNFGLFIPTTTIFDVDRLYEVEVGSEEFKELLVRLYQTVNNIALATNVKTTGYFLDQEFVTGELYFNVDNDFNKLRPVYSKTIDFGALPAAGTKSVAHGIPVTSTYSWVQIYATATDPNALTGLPIGYPSATAVANNLEINVDGTNVNITTGGTDYSAYTTTLVVLKYIKE